MCTSPTDVYGAFWSKLKLVIRDHKIHPDRLPLSKPKFLGNHVYEICLEEPICLISWPCKHSTINKVHIIIDFKEKYKWDTSGIEVLSNIISVYYCYEDKRTKDKSVIIESVNYEYHPSVGASDGDPLLHLHFKHKIPEFELPTILIKKLRNKPGQNIKFHSEPPTFLKGSRIPTIQMSLPDVLCYLVADHIREGVVRTVIEQTEDSLRNLSKYHRKSPRKSHKDFWETLSVRNWYDY